jgi:hypothetical protein
MLLVGTCQKCAEPATAHSSENNNKDGSVSAFVVRYLAAVTRKSSDIIVCEFHTLLNAPPNDR